MIQFDELMLTNGLKVVIHEDPDSTVAMLNIIYDVGSRDENEHMTGFAHLFEHLMFGGSVNIPSYDNVIQGIGGNSNAFTTTDVTNYYCVLPPNNIETGFWLESDRLFGLQFSQQGLEMQKKVVIEEFKERYLNQSYGDSWLHMCKLAYSTHPYRWPAIGKEISHIEESKIKDVKAFFDKFYTPSNAVLVISGKVKKDEVYELCKKWFEPLSTNSKPDKDIPKEPKQTSSRNIEIVADVPLNVIYKAYHIPGLLDKNYSAVELIAYILGEGNSSRLYNELVHNKRYFNNIDIQPTETIDPGLIVISGSLADDVSFEKADSAIQIILEDLKTSLISEKELLKAKNNYETKLILSFTDLLTRTEELAMAALAGNTNLINQNLDKILNVNTEQILASGISTFDENNCSTIYYKKKITKL